MLYSALRINDKKQWKMITICIIKLKILHSCSIIQFGLNEGQDYQRRYQIRKNPFTYFFNVFNRLNKRVWKGAKFSNLVISALFTTCNFWGGSQVRGGADFLDRKK